jgi:hypothetical protein
VGAGRVTLPNAAWSLLDAGRRELRAAVGIAGDAGSATVSVLLNQFADLEMAGQREAALAVFAGPVFTRPPAETRAALGALPRLRSIESVAPQLTRAAGAVTARGGIRLF